MSEKILKEYFPHVSTGRQTDEALKILKKCSGEQLNRLLWQKAGIMAVPEMIREIQEKLKD